MNDKKIIMIAAVDENHAIGINNQLLCHLPIDLKHFKQTTNNHTVIMGRKTFESIGKPLPLRTNIVLSRRADYKPFGVTIVSSLEQGINAVSEGLIYIIGGAQLYGEAYDIADELILTRIHHAFEADAYFPAFNQNRWHCVTSEYIKADENNAYDVTICHYVRKTPGKIK